MQVVSDCPKCGCSFGWTMNRVEATPDGGSRPARAPNCPKCGYDVTGTNDRATRNFHYFAKTDDVGAMRNMVQRPKEERERLTHDYEKRMKEWEEARRQSPPRIANLFGLLSPRRPKRPVLPDVPDVNAPAEGQSLNPLVIAAIYGSENATEFLLNNGVDRGAIPVALESAKTFRHPRVIRLLEAHLHQSQ